MLGSASCSVVFSARAINEHGQIAANGVDSRRAGIAAEHGYLLTPVATVDVVKQLRYPGPG